MDNIKIIRATRTDAPLVVKAIMAALGHDDANPLSWPGFTSLQVKNIFARCSESDDSQYSWRNAFVAVNKDGNVLGVAVSYDGAKLRQLRKRFITEFNREGGNLNESMMKDETTADEWYLDSLAVWPGQRGKGIGTALIKEVAAMAAEAGKPLGLLCDPANKRARKLYESLGFVQRGMRPFAGTLMDHFTNEAQDNVVNR